MRFFQHFLLKCYPQHPLGNENIWTHEVPCLSQNVRSVPSFPPPPPPPLWGQKAVEEAPILTRLAV